MQKFRLFLRCWLPVLVWMTLIFSVSSDQQSSQHSSRFFEPFMHWLFPQMPPAQIEAIHYAFRKGCHLAEYAILALLLWRAIRNPAGTGSRPWRWAEAGLALAIVLLYAASDEWHQSFVPGRTGQAADVAIDVAGAAAALILLWFAGKVFKRW